MQELDILKEVKALEGKLDTIIKELPAKRRQLHARCAARLKKSVDDSVLMSGIQDGAGHVREWQTPIVGTGGGYAAIRPQKGEVGADSPGAVTNYLENGHIIYGSDRRARDFRFYAAARSWAKGILLEEAEQFAEEMGEMLS